MAASLPGRLAYNLQSNTQSNNKKRPPIFNFQRKNLKTQHQEGGERRDRVLRGRNGRVDDSIAFPLEGVVVPIRPTQSR